MNKTELIDKIAAGAEISKEQAKAALNATTSALKEALIAGDKIQLVGFGTFSVNERPAREGINPATKEKIQITAKKVAKFKAGAELADAVSGGAEPDHRQDHLPHAHPDLPVRLSLRSSVVAHRWLCRAAAEIADHGHARAVSECAGHVL